jgi:hypothetical protein
VTAVAVYGALLFHGVARGVGGSDSAGYANTARDILAGRVVVPIDAPRLLGLDPRFEAVFRPLAQEAGPRAATMVPMYPPGFPLHLALAALAAGWEIGIFLVSPVAALVCLLLTYLLGRELSLSRPLAFAGAAVLGVSTPFLFQALQPMSDVVAAMWAVAAVYFALRARRHPAWAVAAGAAFGLAVLVRPANGLLLLPLALALPWRVRTLALFAAAGAPFAAFLGVWNGALYGTAWRTGYAAEHTGLLALANFGPRFARYGGWTLAQLSPLVPLGWIGVAADRRVPRRDRAMLILWFGSIFAFYCFAALGSNWSSMRYLLPGAPALIVGFLLCVRDAARALPEGEAGAADARITPRTLALAAALGVVLFFERRDERRGQPFAVVREQVAYPEACRALAARAPEGRALVVAMASSAALRFYTELVPVRWDRLQPGDFDRLRERAAAKGYRVLALIFRSEAEDAAARVPGNWTHLLDVRGASLWELAPPE